MLWARHCQASYPVSGQVLFYGKVRILNNEYNFFAVDLDTYTQADLACIAFLEVIRECSSGYQCTVENGVPSCQ